jgi:hypothetical protein
MKVIEIDPARVKRLLAPDTHLVRGAGGGIINGAMNVCVMQAVDWLAGGTGLSDVPECADPVIGAFCRRLNDTGHFAEWRDELKPFAAKIVGTKGSPGLRLKRAYMAADWAARTIVPMALQGVCPADAEALRALPEIVNEATSLAAREACRKVNAAAYVYANAAIYANTAATAAAAAAVDAAGAAAAYAAAEAAAAGNAGAYAAADAAAYAASGAARRPYWDAALDLLQRMIDTLEPE